MQEKIQLRHVIDWVLALRALTHSDVVVIRQVIDNTTWSKFADTMTAIAIRQLGLSQERFQTHVIETTKSVTLVQEQKVWNDIIHSPRTPKSKSSYFRRLHIAKRMLKNNWKFNEYADIKSHQLVWREFMGH